MRKNEQLWQEKPEHSRNNQSQDSAAPWITEHYIAQVSAELEGRVTKKLSQEFSRTESRILGELSKLDEFLLNPQRRTFSGTTPGTLRNNDVENQQPGGYRSQNHPHPEVQFSACRASNLTDSDPEETSPSKFLCSQPYLSAPLLKIPSALVLKCIFPEEVLSNQYSLFFFVIPNQMNLFFLQVCFDTGLLLVNIFIFFFPKCWECFFQQFRWRTASLTSIKP